MIHNNLKVNLEFMPNTKQLLNFNFFISPKKLKFLYNYFYLMCNYYLKTNLKLIYIIINN